MKESQIILLNISKKKQKTMNYNKTQLIKKTELKNKNAPSKTNEKIGL